MTKHANPHLCAPLTGSAAHATPHPSTSTGVHTPQAVRDLHEKTCIESHFDLQATLINLLIRTIILVQENVLLLLAMPWDIYYNF